jgi:uncharacterized protein (TIGR02145 family)
MRIGILCVALLSCLFESRAQVYIPGPGVSDFDTNYYSTVIIDGKEWLAENLRTSRYSNGEQIPKVEGNSAWNNLNEGAFCWYDNDSAFFEQPFGKLYNGFVVQDSRNVCPNGWHVAESYEWNSLISFLGGGAVAGGKMKSAANWGGTNESGLTMEGGGTRRHNALFDSFYTRGHYWGSSPTNSNVDYSDMLTLYTEAPVTDIISSSTNFGLSIRCVNDEEITYNSILYGKIFQDYDLDHEYDSGEPLLDDQIVQLTKIDGDIKFQTTSVNGEFFFLVEDSGSYNVSYIPPSNFIESGGISSYTLESVDNVVIDDLNFGVGFLDTVVDISVDLRFLLNLRLPQLSIRGCQYVT